MVGVNGLHTPSVVELKLANPQTSFPRVFDGANLWPSLFQGCGGLVAGAGRVPGKKFCFWAHVLTGTCGAFLRTQEKRPCGLNSVAGVEGSPAGLDVKVRGLGLVGRLRSKLPAPEFSPHEGQSCSLDKEVVYLSYWTGVGGRAFEWNLGRQLGSTTLHWPEARPKPLRHWTWGSWRCEDARHRRLGQAVVCL